MEPPSSQKHRGSIPWKFYLLTVSLFTFQIPPSSAGVNFKNWQKCHPKCNHAELLIGVMPQMAQTLTWIKGDTTNPSNQIGTYTKSTRRFTFGPASNGRKFITPKGTLVIMNASREDTGNYTLAVTRTGNSVLYASVHLVVLEPVTSTTAQEQKYTVQKNEKVAIKCVVREFGYSAYWFFQNQRLHLKDRMKLSNERLGLNIKDIKEEDAGQYYCKFIKRLSTKRTETLTLEVV